MSQKTLSMLSLFPKDLQLLKAACSTNDRRKILFEMDKTAGSLNVLASTCAVLKEELFEPLIDFAGTIEKCSLGDLQTTASMDSYEFPTHLTSDIPKIISHISQTQQELLIMNPTLKAAFRKVSSNNGWPDVPDDELSGSWDVVASGSV
ncbi:hypothetical protein M231_04082 [Tremella mesenterica]|uniref:Uncharacterized protein n=1 Tax=Tremella mesenterica TaxID=5217 RepID=A0A4Q1BLF6_TREME|nr:hypothetical protein M231_04082 [Tremella mesenterica]